MKIKFLLLTFIIGINSLCLSGIAKDRTLKISVNPDFPPYSYLNADMQYDGFSVDIVKTIINDAYPALYNDFVHLPNMTPEVFGLVYQDKVPEGYTFIPYPDAINYYVFTRKKSDLESLVNLYNKKIIVVKGDVVNKNLYENKTSFILQVAKYETALELLSEGINDCAIIPGVTGKWFTEKQDYKNLSFIGTPYISYQIGMAIKSNDQELIRFFQERFEQLIQYNEYSNLKEKWFTQFSHKQDDKKNYSGSTILILILSLILLVLLVFIRMLIKEQTTTSKQLIQSLFGKKIAPMIVNADMQLFDQLINQMTYWVMVSSKDAKVLHVNKELVAEIFDHDYIEKPKQLNDLFSRKNCSELKKMDQAIYTGKDNFIAANIAFQVKNKTVDKWVLKYPIKINGGEISILTFFLDNMVEGAHKVNKLHADYLFKLVLDALPDNVFFKNKKSEYLGCNNAFLEFMGKSKSEIIGKTDLQILGPELAQEYEKSDEITLNEGRIFKDQKWDKNHKGELLKMEHTKIPLRDNSNKIIGLVGISHNITQQHKNEEVLARAKEVAEESDRIKSSFLANMSFEIRNPLNSIIGFSDLLADQDLTHDQRLEFIELIQGNGFKLIELIDDIIDFSKLEAGQLHVKHSNFNLNPLLEEVYTYGQTKKIHFNKEHLNLSLSKGEGDESFNIFSDPFRLRQALKNLINTSMMYTDSDTLMIGYLNNDKQLLFYVKSTSTQVDHDLFNLFSIDADPYQFNFSDIEESSGISLIIAKNIIELLGGKLLSKNLNTGLPEFFFTIPLLTENTMTSTLTSQNQELVPNWRNKTVLVAEDEEINYILLAQILKDTNIKIIRAINGEEAIEFYSNTPEIDLVLMDMRMPKVNGIAASEEILKINPSAVIIAQTAYALPEDKDRYLSIGIKSVVAKPIKPADLYLKCNKFLNK